MDEKVVDRPLPADADEKLREQAVEELRGEINDPLGPWQRPQSVIRFGYGTQIRPTPRRPAEDVLIDE